MNPFFRDYYYQFIFENSLEAILLTSPEGSIYRANPAACDMFQRTEAEICQVGCKGIVDVTDERFASVMIKREEDKKVKSELTFLRRNGSRFPGEFSSAIFCDSEEKPWSVTIIRDLTVVKEAEAKAIHDASHDYITGLLNRRAFEQELQKEMSRVNLLKLPMSMILIDIDHFKKINDVYGHQCGDMVLKKFAHTLGKNLRSYDLVGRYGGDEFIVCLPKTMLEEAIAIAERLRNKVEQMKIDCKPHDMEVTASFGVVYYDYNSAESEEELIARVDRSMYRAKAKRNCVLALNE